MKRKEETYRDKEAIISPRAGCAGKRKEKYEGICERETDNPRVTWRKKSKGWGCEKERVREVGKEWRRTMLMGLPLRVSDCPPLSLTLFPNLDPSSSLSGTSQVYLSVRSSWQPNSRPTDTYSYSDSKVVLVESRQKLDLLNDHVGQSRQTSIQRTLLLVNLVKLN